MYKNLRLVKDGIVFELVADNVVTVTITPPNGETVELEPEDVCRLVEFFRDADDEFEIFSFYETIEEADRALDESEYDEATEDDGA
jgi:hypothetical protein